MLILSSALTRRKRWKRNFGKKRAKFYSQIMPHCGISYQIRLKAYLWYIACELLDYFTSLIRFLQAGIYVWNMPHEKTLSHGTTWYEWYRTKHVASHVNIFCQILIYVDYIAQHDLPNILLRCKKNQVTMAKY